MITQYKPGQLIKWKGNLYPAMVDVLYFKHNFVMEYSFIVLNDIESRLRLIEGEKFGGYIAKILNYEDNVETGKAFDKTQNNQPYLWWSFEFKRLFYGIHEEFSLLLNE